jgi:hypothetical protein
MHIRPRLLVLTGFFAVVAILAVIPGTAIAPPGPESLKTNLGSLRQLLWPTRIEAGPTNLPGSAVFRSATGGADTVLQSNRFQPIGTSNGWFTFRSARAGIEPIFEAAQSRVQLFSSKVAERVAFARYSRVRFHEVYAGIDLIYYVAPSGDLQFDFRLAAGADPRNIVIDLPQGGEARVDRGAVELRLDNAAIRLAPPVAWQQSENGRQPVDVAFRLSNGTLGFELGAYDPRLPLVIDPLVVADSTFLGSNTNEDVVRAMSLDAQGNIYLVGVTQFDQTGTFPSTASSYVMQWRPPGACAFSCMFVLKLSPTYQIQYGALIPQTSPNAIAVNGAGEAVVVGHTLLAGDFPWTAGAFSTEPEGQGFLLKLGADGAALAYAASFNAREATAVALRGDGVVVVSGNIDAPGLLTTPTSLKPSYQANGNIINEEGFVLEISANGSTLLAGTYLGGLLKDSANAITVDAQSRVTVTGSFSSSDMTGMPGSPAGLSDVYIARLSPDLSTVISYRILGGSGSDGATALVADSQGGWLATGTTTSSDLPVTTGVIQNRNRGTQTGWVARLDSNLAPQYVTYYGGEYGDGVAAATIDAQGNAYLAGTTFSFDMPATSDAFQDVTSLGTREGYFAVLNPTGSTLLYGTYLGGYYSWPRGFSALTGAWGIARSGDGRVYVGGSTQAASFPVTGNSLRAGMGGTSDAFLVRFEDQSFAVTTNSLLFQARTTAPYSRQLIATGGRTPYTWSVAGFQLPDGLSLSPAGVISGTAKTTQTESGEYQFTVAVRDADGKVANKSLFIGVAYPGNWYCDSGLCTIDLQINQMISYGMPTLHDAQPPVTYGTTGTLPPGINISAAGSMAGAPTVAGTTNVTLQVTDATGSTGSLNLRFIVTDPNAPSTPPTPPVTPPVTPPSSPPASGGGGMLGTELLLLGLLTAISVRRRLVRKTLSVIDHADPELELRCRQVNCNRNIEAGPLPHLTRRRHSRGTDWGIRRSVWRERPNFMC